MIIIQVPSLYTIHKENSYYMFRKGYCNTFVISAYVLMRRDIFTVKQIKIQRRDVYEKSYINSYLRHNHDFKYAFSNICRRRSAGCYI